MTVRMLLHLQEAYYEQNFVPGGDETTYTAVTGAPSTVVWHAEAARTTPSNTMHSRDHDPEAAPHPQASFEKRKMQY